MLFFALKIEYVWMCECVCRAVSVFCMCKTYDLVDFSLNCLFLPFFLKRINC